MVDVIRNMPNVVTGVNKEQLAGGGGRRRVPAFSFPRLETARRPALASLGAVRFVAVAISGRRSLTRARWRSSPLPLRSCG